MMQTDLIQQKEGYALIPAAWPPSGTVRVTNLAGTDECLAKSIQSTAAGTVVVHLHKNYDSTGAKVYTAITLTAAPLVSGNVDLASVNEVACAFDEIREEGTTIALSALTVWI